MKIEREEENGRKEREKVHNMRLKYHTFLSFLLPLSFSSSSVTDGEESERNKRRERRRRKGERGKKMERSAV